MTEVASIKSKRELPTEPGVKVERKGKTFRLSNEALEALEIMSKEGDRRVRKGEIISAAILRYQAFYKEERKAKEYIKYSRKVK